MDWDDYWGQILAALDGNPPEDGDWAMRESAFFAIDRVFQDPHVTGSGGELDLAAPDGVLERVFESRLERALLRLGALDPARGVTVTQVYNAGYIVAAGGLRVGFDVKYPSRNDPWAFGWDADPALEDALAGACDLLFVTHDHSDHADEDIWGRVLARGRHVVSPATLRSSGGRHIRLDGDAGFDLEGLAVRAFRTPMSTTPTASSSISPTR